MSYFQDDGHEVISLIYCKVMPTAECTRRVCPAYMQQRPAVPDRWVSSHMWAQCKTTQVYTML